ncbi:hypothetical protein L1049_026882 [Liquidambar formosana]|uniref:Uncharacterized protein n=1 Tax=Liquidambar formosana TaxID=63359 RepID=A0AAP0NDG7_LIQFO
MNGHPVYLHCHLTCGLRMYVEQRTTFLTSLIARSSSKTSYAEITSPSITEGEILSAPILKAFSFNELKNSTLFSKDGLMKKTLAAAKPGSGMVVTINMHIAKRILSHEEWLV